MEASDSEDLFPSSVNHQPLLMQLHGKTDKQEFMDQYDHSTVERKIPQLKGKLCLGCFEDWLLLADESTKVTFFLHRTLDPKLNIYLPPLRGESFERLGSCVISSSPTSQKCVVILVGRGRNVILYCRPKTNVIWTKVQVPIDPRGNNSFTGQVVKFKGKIYVPHGATVAHRVLVINEESLLKGNYSWTIIKLPHRMLGWWHLVVSGDHDLFLVFFATSALRLGTPTTCTVHRLKTSDQTWKRAESIGGCVFFLGGIQNEALPAVQAGTQRDCIYVLHQNYGLRHGEGVYKICMQDQTVSLSLLLKKPRGWICKLCWLMPTRVNRSIKSKCKALSFSHSIGIDKSEVCHVQKGKKEEEKCKIDISRPWADLPIELVQLLLPRLNLIDCLRLPSICKAWNSVSNYIQDAKVYPWLLYSANDSCLLRLVDPIYGKAYSIDMKWFGPVNNLMFHYSKDGWVLASKENKYLFLINPLTRESIGLPDMDHAIFTVMSFSSSPTNLDCVVFIVQFADFDVMEILTWSPGADEWSMMSFNNEFGLFVPCNPVFTREEFYFYKLNGEILVYNPKKKTMQTLAIKAPIEITEPIEMEEEFVTRIIQCHLMETRGDLLTVFRKSSKDPLRIFKLDRLNMVWSEVDDVGDLTVFLNHKTSFAKSCLEKRCHNLIYLSGFADEHCKSITSYSLETNKYYPVDCYHHKQPMNCIWIEPSLTA
ncbi:F-box protein family-like [Rhynchospora pubera]|uniref:F-box protein family-like n=1 Tax=Rhynchospora pubera TaxID=906938 RepID=A0AAV8DP07_9POAL|nr:F-box protein family-like [Rhynchospora pubera]